MSDTGPIPPVAPPRPADARPADAAASAPPPLDPARAHALKEAIVAGRYPLDTARLAERLIALGILAKPEND